MDPYEQDIAEDFTAAAVVHAAKREVDSAIAALASRPLDENTADKMREVLNSPKIRKARRLLVRLQGAPKSHLSVIPGRSADTETGSEGSESALGKEPEERLRLLQGAFAGGVA